MEIAVRVLFDGRWLSGNVPSGRRWLYSMLPALHRARPAWDLVVAVAPDADLGSLGAEICRPHVRRGMDLPGVVAGAWLNREGRRVGADVVVSQFFGAYRRTRVPMVVVVHDALWVEHPDWFATRVRAQLAFVGPSLRGSHVVTVSGASADQVVAAGLATTRPSVVHNGVDPAPVPVGLGDRSGILVVGRPNVRKNLVTAIRAWEAATVDEPLVVVGCERAEAEAVVGHALPDQVVFTGRVDDDALQRHYATARMLLAPSLGEGFSLPPLEAMVHGTPVVASDIPVHRELYEGTAVLVDPQDVGAWSMAITGLLAATDWQVRHEAGRGRAASLTWDDAAAALAAVLEGQVTP